MFGPNQHICVWVGLNLGRLPIQWLWLRRCVWCYLTSQVIQAWYSIPQMLCTESEFVCYSPQIFEKTIYNLRQTVGRLWEDFWALGQMSCHQCRCCRYRHSDSNLVVASTMAAMMLQSESCVWPLTRTCNGWGAAVKSCHTVHTSSHSGPDIITFLKMEITKIAFEILGSNDDALFKL